jgi:N-acyl-D-amino-acid deacylase
MSPKESQFDIILRGGAVVDGTGSSAFMADVAIRGERIAKMGDLEEATARSELNVEGLVIAPGFIDVHSHDDAALIESPQMMPKLTQGVTTVIAGNCGMSGAPISCRKGPPAGLRLIFKSSRALAPSFKKMISKVEAAAPAVNAAFLTGHSTLRMQVMGDDLRRPANAFEVARMRDLLARCLEEGSLGLSTGLFYPEARAALTDEVIHVAEPLKDYRGVYVTHMRNEGDQILESIEESLQIGRAVETPVIVSHHKCLGQKNFGRSVETLARLEVARQQQRVAWDVYPYTAGSTTLNQELVTQSQSTVITWCDRYPEFAGQELSRVARTLGLPIEEAIRHLQPAGALYFMMDEADVKRILKSSAAMIGSDGLPSDQHPHPRLWGTFPRVLGRYVRKEGLLGLEEAVHRMTGLSAAQFGLRERGHVQSGYFADLCIFDAHAVLDIATYEHPTLQSIGIHHVFVNGSAAIENGQPTGRRVGRALVAHRPSN